MNDNDEVTVVVHAYTASDSVYVLIPFALWEADGLAPGILQVLQQTLPPRKPSLLEET